jgi:hypothetical protein
MTVASLKTFPGRKAQGVHPRNAIPARARATHKAASRIKQTYVGRSADPGTYQVRRRVCAEDQSCE